MALFGGEEDGSTLGDFCNIEAPWVANDQVMTAEILKENGVSIDATQIITLVTNPLEDDSKIAPGDETATKQTIW
jgi:hypothetical protein